MMDITELEKKAGWVRAQVLDMVGGMGGAHIAPSLSCTELLVSLYHGGMLRVAPDSLNPDERDRFILSKGHGCLGLYVVLADMGFLSFDELGSFCQDGSRLGAHPDLGVPGIDVSTGSLGHGLSIGAGMALAARMDDKDYITFVLMSDGECQEGSIWEAAMFASHHRLDNLVAIIDRNKLQATAPTEQVVGLESLPQKWESFGWEVRSVDGHSIKDILLTMGDIRSRQSEKPLAVIARTTKGKGISFMENNPIWHYRVPQGDEMEQARQETRI
ncbi:transketolase [Chloroflexota bacterium]